MSLNPALVLSALTLALPAFATAECSSEWVEVDAVEDVNRVELHARNRNGAPVTITLQVWTRHMTADRPGTVTETVEPGTSEVLMVLTGDDKEPEAQFGFDCDWTIGSIDATHDDDLIYWLPYEEGKSYYVLQGYGSRLSHTGPEEFTVDFKMREGTAVHAARGGIVAITEESHSKGCWKAGCGKYANYIVILHDDWTTGEYYHLQKDGVLVEVGERVVAGQRIGLSGDTGNSALPHLHFGVYRAAAWGKFQSIPVQFRSSDGIIRKPRRGGRYQAVSIRSSARNDVGLAGSTRSLH